MRRLRVVAGLVLPLVALLLSGCILEAGAGEFVAGGDPDRGEALIIEYGCSACHYIPGIPSPEADVGPPLYNWPERAYIAGTIPNTPEHTVLWLQDPQAFEPGTSMPNLDVSEAEARDIAAYLYNLR